MEERKDQEKEMKKVSGRVRGIEEKGGRDEKERIGGGVERKKEKQ